jgi:hypothetical protein
MEICDTFLLQLCKLLVKLSRNYWQPQSLIVLSSVRTPLIGSLNLGKILTFILGSRTDDRFVAYTARFCCHTRLGQNWAGEKLLISGTN